MVTRSKLLGLLIVALSFFLVLITPIIAQAEINRVRVVNDTDKTVYIHVGGFAVSERIEPGKWKIFSFPFETTPPGAKEAIKSSLLVATSGGKWVTTANGLTYLSKPTLVICLDYKSPEHAQKSGNRVWTIKSANGFDQGCEVKGYKQAWYKDNGAGAAPTVPAPTAPTTPAVPSTP